MRIQRLSARAAKRVALGLVALAGGAVVFRVALAASHHGPAPRPQAAQLPQPPPSPPKIVCDCSKVPKDPPRSGNRNAADAPTIGPDSAYDVILPDAALWQAVHVGAGAEEWFGANVPLASGPNPTDGGWKATFGRISRDGARYQAPDTSPPEGVDIITYTGPSYAAPIAIQFLVYVDDPAFDDGSDTPAQIGAVDNLLELAPAKAAPLPDGAFWPALPPVVSGASTIAIKAGAKQADVKEAGYPISRWASSLGRDAQGNEKRVIIGIRRENPVTGKNRKEPPVTSRQTSPFNAAPPFPPCRNRYFSAVGARYAMPNDGKIHWVCSKARMTGWSTFGRLKGRLPAEVLDRIKKKYRIGFEATTNFDMPTQSAEIRQSCFHYVDHYKSSDDGRNWIYTGSEMYEKEGIGKIYVPAWIECFDGYSPFEETIFRPEYPRGPIRRPN